MAAKIVASLILFTPFALVSLVMLVFGGWAIKDWESPLDKLLEWAFES